MALFYKEKNKDIRVAAYLRLSIEDGDKAESNSIGNQRTDSGFRCRTTKTAFGRRICR